MSVINQSDFVGKWQVSLNKFSELTPYIHRYEPVIVKRLLGDELGQEFIDDDDLPKFDDLKLIGFGLKSLLVGLIYFEYVRDLPYRVTNKGVVYQQDDNASQVITAYVLRQRYNECVTDWKEMQKYCRKEFDNFDGEDLKYMTD